MVVGGNVVVGGSVVVGGKVVVVGGEVVVVVGGSVTVKVALAVKAHAAPSASAWQAWTILLPGLPSIVSPNEKLPRASAVVVPAATSSIVKDTTPTPVNPVPLAVVAAGLSPLAGSSFSIGGGGAWAAA